MTLGQVLKEKRSSTGRSLEQISASTRIHARILQAIEEDRYADLPARTFTRGFIVNYAKALGLNPEELLKDHHDFLEQKFSERPDRDQGHHGYAFEGKELEQTRRWTWIGLGAAGLFALAVVLVFKPGNKSRKEKHKELATELAAESPAEPSPSASPGSSTPSPSPMAGTSAIASATPTPSPLPPPVATPAPTATPVLPAEPVAESTPVQTPTPDKLNKGDDLSASQAAIRLVVQTETDAWVRYRSDERPVGMIILRKGKSVVIKAKERILFEGSPSAKLKYRIGSGAMKDLEANRFELAPKGQPLPYSGTELGKKPLSDEVPAPKTP